MSTINNNFKGNDPALEQLVQDINALMNNAVVADTDTKTLPDPNKIKQLDMKNELPILDKPKEDTLSLEALLSAIQFEARKLACKSGIENLEAKAKEQQELNLKNLEEMKKQLETMEQSKTLAKFKKAFQIIGMVVGAIASIATIAVGVLTANPLLVVGGAMALIAVVDSIVSMASDGKYSMMKGFTELGMKMGMSEQDATWFALGCQILYSVITIAITCGAGSSSAVTEAMRAASKVGDIINYTQMAANYTNAAVSVAQGCASIAGATFAFQIAESQVSQKELEAVLELLRQFISEEKALFEAEMERANEDLKKVSEIVDGCNKTQTMILGGPNLV